MPYSTTTCLTVSLQNASPICLDLELLVLAHHAQEPFVGFTSRVDAMARGDRPNVTSVGSMSVSGYSQRTVRRGVRTGSTKLKPPVRSHE